MSNFNEERVLSVHHWTDTLFSFTTTRDPAFRFRNGEFTMIGLKVDEKPLLRAYSVVSANYEEHLEFFSIKVQDGPLTSRLQHLKVGDPIIVSRKATGHAGARQPDRRAATSTSSAPARASRRSCQHHQGPRDLRALREGRADPRLPAGERARLWRDDHARTCRRTSSSAS